jgi:hypothetical protein
MKWKKKIMLRNREMMIIWVNSTHFIAVSPCVCDGPRQTLEGTGALDCEGERLAEIKGRKEAQMQKLREAAEGRSW